MSIVSISLYVSSIKTADNFYQNKHNIVYLINQNKVRLNSSCQNTHHVIVEILQHQSSIAKSAQADKFRVHTF
jgi:hypothetical protein